MGVIARHPHRRVIRAAHETRSAPPADTAAGIVGWLAWTERVLPRWLAGSSLFIAAAVAIVTVGFNLPWSSGLVSPLWLIAVSAAALVARRRASRA